MPRNYFGELEEALETTGATQLHLYYYGHEATFQNGVAQYKGRTFTSLTALGNAWVRSWNTTRCYCDVEVEDNITQRRRRWDLYLTSMEVDASDSDDDDKVESKGKDWSGFIQTFVEHDPSSMKKVVKTIKMVDPKHKFSKDEVKCLAIGFSKMSTEDNE